MELDGPRQAPASGGDPKQLVILLHGLGADGADLIGLAPHWGEILPDAAFAAPNAPFPCDMSPMGYQWFSVQDRTPTVVLAAVQAVAPALNAFIDQELERAGLGADKLALVGFSQGTMMSLYVAPRREPSVAAVVGYSGRLIAPERLPEEAVSKPPVLLIHGEMDDLVPFESMAQAEQGLEAADFTVQTLACPGLGHGIDPRGLQHGGGFLKAAFAD
ncbi:MAG: alpha/beta fold hydrolase [Alphaproteobacteria bacterium]|nr:alpha/beta fold hydrolase [Alphaproteobacteria bacterium]